MKIHCLQHAEFEGLGAIRDWAKKKGLPVATTHPYRGEIAPRLDDFDLLVVLGGPMGADDDERHPWLTDEKRFIEQSVESGKRVLGICLGAQLLAAVLGARVHRNRYREIGWFPIRFTAEARAMPALVSLPAQLTAFHWHGDTFDVPRSAVRLAESDACPNQGFLYGNTVLGLQFHLETDEAGLLELIRNCPEDLTGGPYVQRAGEMLDNSGRFETANATLRHILDRFCRRD